MLRLHVARRRVAWVGGERAVGDDDALAALEVAFEDGPPHSGAKSSWTSTWEVIRPPEKAEMFQLLSSSLVA
ncbi:hypothetical protein SFUMM280S_08019 [Streptomyces fumanus]